MSRHQLTKTRYPGVYRRPDGRLVIRVAATSSKTGKQVERSKLLPEGTTLAEARGRLEELAALARGDRETVRPPTVGDFAPLWLQRKIKRGEWRVGSTTASVQTTTLELHILPALGDIYLDKLETIDLVQWMDAQLDSGASPNSVRSRWATLQGLVAEACSDYQIPDVTKGVRPPRRPARGGEDMVLMPDQVRAALAWVQAERPEWASFAWLGFASGARLSELCVVQVGDLDLTGDVGRWTIRRHYGLAETIVPGSKSGPERLVYLDPVTTEALRPAVAGKFPADWLTSVPHFRRPGSGAPTRRQVRTLTDALGTYLGVTVSSKLFRQTHNTLARLSGVALAVVHEQIGHTSEAMSNVYTRIPAEAREAAARKWGEVIAIRDDSRERVRER